MVRRLSIEMVEQGVSLTKNPASPIVSGDRKRSPSTGDRYETIPKRRITDVSTLSLPMSAHGGMHMASYPVSYSGSYSSQSRSSSDALPQHNLSQSAQLAHSNRRYEESMKADMVERSEFPNYDTSLTHEGYPGQFDNRQVQGGGYSGRRDDDGNPPMPLYSPPPTKRSRFNLSRYQLDDDEDLFASLPDQSIVQDEAKTNRFKTQRERLMEARSDQSDEESASLSLGNDSSSQDSFMSQRERLRQFRNEHSRHVVIPNQWEGENRLHEFVAFGNMEAALRPLGLMMARAALVNDSVTSRHLRRASSGAAIETVATL